jgi:hypothetical protein
LAPQTNAQVAALQFERVSEVIPVLYERGDETAVLIQKADDVEVSTIDLRLPLQINPGGLGGYYNPEGGAMGVGNAETYDKALVNPVFIKMAFGFTTLTGYATDSSVKAVAKSVVRVTENGLKQFRSYIDKLLNASSSGVLGTIASITGGTTLNMAVPNGAQLVYNSQQILIYDPTLTINRSALAGVVTTVLAADPVTTQTIVVDQLPAGTQANDVIMSAGLVGANPQVLFGIKYNQNNATTGTFLSLNRATYPVQLATPRVNGNGGALVPMQPELAVAKIRKSVGLSKVGKLIAHTAIEQKHAWDQLATTVQIIDRAQHESGGGVDMNPTSYKDFGSGNMHGVPIKVAQNADQTRVDFLDLSSWGRAVIKPMGFFKGANGKVYFQQYAADGGIAAAELFYYDYGFQVWNREPRKGAFIDNLARPAGY